MKKNFWYTLGSRTPQEMVTDGFESVFDSVKYIEPEPAAIAWETDSKCIHEFKSFYELGKELGLKIRVKVGTNVTLHDLILRGEDNGHFYVLAFLPRT